MDLIVRNFSVMRGGRKVEYPFTTYSSIFVPSNHELVYTVYQYLKEVFMFGHPDFSGKISASEGPNIITQIEERKSDLVEYARSADYRGRNNGQHLCVQQYLLENDPNTCAIEVPVWDDDFSGHIDILRIFPDVIEIADFKPRAGRETKAASQLTRYKIMLSRRLNLPRSIFRCVYFDDCYSYFIK